jgi:6,7-dimethyl-8-ribityllumazine synthase
MAKHSSNLYNTTGIQLPQDAFVVIVCTEWNEDIIAKLKLGATQVLQDYKVAYQIITVPGAFEIPFAVKKYWETATKKPNAFITLGCVIKGDTPHFDYVCKGVTEGVMQLNLLLPVPTIFGVLTVNTEVQAWERLGGTHGHKGEEAAVGALKMIATPNP